MRHLGIRSIFIAQDAFGGTTTLYPHLREAVARVESRLTDDSDNDHTINLNQHHVRTMNSVRE